MQKLIDRLQGSPFVTRWVVAAAELVRAFWLYLTWFSEQMVGLYEKCESFLTLVGHVFVVWPMQLVNRLLAPRRDTRAVFNGLPGTFRLCISMLTVWPVMFVRFCLLAAVIAFWLIHWPNAVYRVWKGIEQIDTPNKERTPQKSRPSQRLDDFDGVRARIREL